MSGFDDHVQSKHASTLAKWFHFYLRNNYDNVEMQNEVRYPFQNMLFMRFCPMPPVW